MRRREFITLVGGAAAAWPLEARAQQGQRMRRIGVLTNLASDDPAQQSRVLAFAQALAQSGWTEGRNVRIDIRWSATDPERVRRYAAELVALAPDVILSAGSADAGEIERAITAFAQPSNGGLMVAAGAAAFFRRDVAIKLAAQHRLPALYLDYAFVTDGGLIAYGPDRVDQFRRAADYVDRILKGEKPADLPVQAPTKYDLTINLKTAKALGLDVPPSLLARADEVIE
jgi:hypothetical protein